MITGRTQLLGVAGYPVEHSLSPAMHNAAIAEMGLDFAYLPFPVAPDDLERAIAGFAALGGVGLNLTIPHKQAIVPLLAEQTAVAQAVGAVNTIWRGDRGWCGTNTDVAGFVAPLKDEANWGDARAIVLGNGGAARAVVAGLTQLGCAEIVVVGRNAEKLAVFAESWTNSPLKVRLQVYTMEKLPELLPQTRLLVNTTPVGMAGDGERTPVSAQLLDRLPADGIAYDLIYTPRPTRFLQLAAARGLRAIDGTTMLVRQGAEALNIWTQQAVPVETMQAALLRHLA